MRVGGIVVGCTFALTASFFGAVAIVTGEANGLAGRLPFYVLGAAIVFVVALVVLDDLLVDGVAILQGAGGVGVGAFVFFTLGVEGIAFAVSDPGKVVATQLFLYVVAAGMIASGIGFWAIRHGKSLTVTKGSSL